MPKICKFYGDFTYELFERSCALEEPYKNFVFPGFDFSTCEDVIRGTYQNIAINLHETTLRRKVESKNGHVYPRVFRGLVIGLQFRKKIKSKMLIIKGGLLKKLLINLKRKVLQSKRFDGLKPVDLEDRHFESLFQVFSDDQVESRFILTTAFMERLISLAKLRGKGKGAHFTCSFKGKELLIVSPNLEENLFEPRGIHKNILQMEDLHIFLDQMHHIFQLIDSLKLNRI